jgi:hypothetical protein
MSEKFRPTPGEASHALALSLRPLIQVAMYRYRNDADMEPVFRDILDLLRAEVPHYEAVTIRSPYADVTDTAWREAYVEACRLVYERENVKRDPERHEIDAVLKGMDEARYA